MVLGGVKICANFRQSRLLLPCLDTIGKNSSVEIPSEAAQNGVSCDFRVVDVVVYFLSNSAGGGVSLRVGQHSRGRPPKA